MNLKGLFSTTLISILYASLGWASPTVLGKVMEYRSSSGGLEVRTEGGRLFLVPLEGGAVRVQLLEEGANPELRSSYSVEKEEIKPVPYTLQETPNVLRLSFEGFAVDIEKDPVRLAFLGPSGGVVAQEPKPLEFEPATNGDGFKASLTLALSNDTHVYGLGEKTGPLDKIGRRFTLWNLDNFGYTPDSDPLYLSCPFFVGLKGGEAYGMFFDNPSKMTFDFGSSDPNQIVVSQDGGRFVCFIFFGPKISQVVKRYARLTGFSPMPPIWALGHAYSFRYSDRPKEDILEALQNAKRSGFPLDALWMDTWSMDGFKSFTVGIPDFPRLVESIRGMGVHLVNLVDPLIEADENYRVFQEGKALDAFVKNKDGAFYTGMSPVAQLEGLDKGYVLPDFTRKDVRDWWGGLFQEQLDSGIEGFWHDLNEPTIVSSVEEWLVNYPKTLPDNALFAGEDGHEKLLHAQVHNAYGLLMAKASFEGLKRLQVPKRPFLVSRSGFSGTQRHAWVWTGDNVSSFEHLSLAHRMFLGMGLSGIPFAGSDIGGFVPVEWPELTVRWYQASVMTPLYRKHKSNPLAYDHGPWTLPEPYFSAAKKAILLRYELLPYLYTLTYQASTKGEPILRPLVYGDQDDETARSIDDEYFAGDNMLIAPIFEPGAKERRMYLPRGTWYDFSTKNPLKGPVWIQVPAYLDTIPLLIKAGSVIPRSPLDPPVSASSPEGTVLIDVYPQDDDKAAESFLYLDDGATMSSTSALFRFSLQRNAKKISLDIEKEGPYDGVKTFEVRVYGTTPAAVLQNGKPLPFRTEGGSAVFLIEAASCRLEVVDGH